MEPWKRAWGSPQASNHTPPWERQWNVQENPDNPEGEVSQVEGSAEQSQGAIKPWNRKWGDTQSQTMEAQTLEEQAVEDYGEAGGGVLPSLERGARRLKQSLAGAGAALGDALVDDQGVFDTSPVGEWLQSQTERDRQEVVGHQKEIEKLPQHPTMARAVESANKEDSYLGAAGAFVKEVADSPDTSGFLIDQAAELAPQILSFFVGAKGTDKLLPVAMQGMTRISAAMAGGGFISSVANTFGPNVGEALQKGFEYDQAEARAALQSITQGGVDALTSAVVPWRIGPGQVTNIPAQTFIQMLGGATGEIARKKVVGEEAEKGEVAAEALLEVLGLPGDVMASISLKSTQKAGEAAKGDVQTEENIIPEGVQTEPVQQASTPVHSELEAFAQGKMPAAVFEPGAKVPAAPKGAKVGYLEGGRVLFYRDEVTLQKAIDGQLAEALAVQQDQTIDRNVAVPIEPTNSSAISSSLAEKNQIPDQPKFAYEDVSDKSFAVIGEAEDIRTKLVDAGITKKGMPNKKRGGLTFSRNDEEDIRAALGQSKSEDVIAHEVDNPQAGISSVTEESKLVADLKSEVGSDTSPVVTKASIDVVAHEAATSPQNNLSEPTEAEKKAGNYRKAKLNFNGLQISIENPTGSMRSGTDPGGKKWSQEIKHHYGYIRQSEAKDGDHVDVFLGDNAANSELPVFVIDQVNPKTGKYDEAKVVMGASTEAEAAKIYLANYEKGWKGLGGIKQMPLDKFKTWVKNPQKTKHRASVKKYRYSKEDEMPKSGVNSFSPGASYVGFVNDAKLKEKAEPKAGKPIRREDVLIPFLKALKVPLYQGRIKRKGVLGNYMPKKEAVRIKHKNDLETAAHELAHLIDDRVPEIKKSFLKKEHRDELKSVSYDTSKVYEGFAEFVRLYMTQNEKAKEAAPQYYKWFQQFTQRHEYGPHIEKARKAMTKWYEQSAIQRAASKIGGPRKPINEAIHNTIHGFRQAVSDDLDGIYTMERNLTGKINPVGPYETARLTRGSHSMVEGALTIGAPIVNPDRSFSFKGKGLETILEPVSDRIEDWTRYAVGRSAQELMLQGREHLFTRAEITAMLRLETPEFKKAFREYQTWNHRVVDFAQALGIINPETRKLWKRAQYLPFYRLHTGQRQQADSGVSGDWKGIARLTGGTDNLRDVLQNMIQNASHLMVEAVRNDARVQVANLADRVRGGGRFMVKIARDAKPIKISKDEIVRIVNQAGIIPEDVTGDFSKLKDLVNVFQFGQAPKGKNVTAVMRGGKPIYYEVGDPLLMRAMTSLDRPTKNWITRVLSGFRRVGQSSVTLSLDFMAANIARDTLMGGIMSKHGFKPFMDSIRGMRSRVKKDKDYQEAIANGIGFSSIYLDDKAFKKKLERFYGKKGVNYKTVIDGPAKFLYALETMADAFEMSTRLGEFKRARAAGAHPKHAAYLGREVSTDFAMRGDSEVLGFFFDTVMFLKAGVNGMDRLYRGFAHDDNKRQIATRTALLALTSMALYGINRDNELYDKLEDWDKDTHWHFFIPKPGMHEGTSVEDRYHHFRYPKLWEIGAVSSMAERSMEGVMNSAPKKLSRDFLRIVLDQFKLDYVPQAIRPMYEQYLNRNRFTGAPIETSTMEQLAPFARSKPYTAKVLKEAGLKSRHMPRELQIAPARTEALLRGYLSTWAMYGLALTDAALYDDKPDMRVDQYPVMRRFYAKTPMKRTKFETKFYDMFREATELRRTIKQMDRIGRPDIADEIEERKEVGRYKQLTRGNKKLQGIKKEMHQVYIDPLLTPKKKRIALDRLLHEKNELLETIVTDIQAQEIDQISGGSKK